MRASELGLRAILVAVLAPVLLAATPVRYELTFPNVLHHEARIVATFESLDSEEPLILRLSRSSPGRYALHEFGRNVYSVTAVNGRGEALEIDRPDPYQWLVRNHDGSVRLSYTLFGDHADGTYNAIGTRFIQLNAPATFMWSPGLEHRPVEVEITPPDPAWTVATQLFPAQAPLAYEAPDLRYLLDSPIHIGPLEWRTWEVREGATPFTIRLAVDHAGTPEQVDEYAAMAEQVVAEQIRMWRDIPDFEPGTYTFIATYLPSVNGDGMEHRNSTVLTSTRDLETEAKRNLNTLSHEFFHAWNVERLRPASLEPFDFTRANMSAELWFTEGFTSYYDGLFIRRAGLTSDDEWAEDLSSLVEGVVNSPARGFRSVVEASRLAPYVDAATAVDADNGRNTFFSYYPWGAAIAAGLDLSLRAEYDLTLDDLMRAMWIRFGRAEVPYANSDIEAVLAELTTETFASGFFERFIEGREVPDYAALLRPAGFLVRRKNADRAWLGAPVADREGKVTIDDRTLIGSPFHRAGIDKGDVIVSINGRAVEGAAYLQAVADLVPPGTSLELELERQGETVMTTLTLSEDPEIEVVTYEEAGLPLSSEQKEFRSSWLDEGDVEPATR